MTEQEFARGGNWDGSWYELAIRYRAGVAVQQLLRALHTLWQHPSLEGPLSGPYATHTPALTPTALPSRLEDMSSMYGVLHLPQGGQSAASQWSCAPAPSQLKKSRHTAPAGCC